MFAASHIGLPAVMWVAAYMKSIGKVVSACRHGIKTADDQRQYVGSQVATFSATVAIRAAHKIAWTMSGP